MHFAVEFRRIFILLLVIKSVLGRIPTYSLGEPEDCRAALGCFPLGSPWESSERPVSLPPLPTESIAPRFCLLSNRREPCKEFNPTNKSSLASLPLNTRSELILITHGFIESSEIDWMDRMANALIAAEDQENRAIIKLDWAKGAYPPYAQAVANIRLIGAATGHALMILIEKFRLETSKIHLIGHSLGSHLMGYAGTYVGEKTQRKVGRITGLDPAGPYFRDTPEIVRLDPSDAEFVDVIHTDSNDIIPGIPFSLGNPDSLGHMDFYPNGGGIQPGCSSNLGDETTREEINEDITRGFFNFMGCHHQRSLDYFTASITSNCSYLSVPCDSFEDYQKGLCWNDNRTGSCSVMGYKAAGCLTVDHTFKYRVPGIKLFRVMGDQNFLCETQHRITLSVSSSPASLAHGGDSASFRLTVRGRNSQSFMSFLPPEGSDRGPLFWTPSSSHSFVLASFGLEDVKYLILEHLPEDNLLKFFIWRFSKPVVYLEGITIEELGTGYRKFFTSSGEGIIEGEVKLFLPRKFN